MGLPLGMQNGWLRASGSGSGNNRTIRKVTLGVCCTPLDKGEKTHEVFFKQLEEVSESQIVVLTELYPS